MALNLFDFTYPRAPARFYRLTPWDDLGNSLYSMNRRMREMDNQFDDIFNQFLTLHPSAGRPTPGKLMRGESLIEDAVKVDKDGNRKFQLCYDVRNFKPENISIKTVDNKRLEVTAKQEEGDDNHRMYREYHRSCTLPEGVDPEQLKSLYTPDGVLSIEAPMLAIEPPAQKEQPMEVAHNEPVAISIQHEKAKEK